MVTKSRHFSVALKPADSYTSNILLGTSLKTVQVLVMAQGMHPKPYSTLTLNIQAGSAHLWSVLAPRGNLILRQAGKKG